MEKEEFIKMLYILFCVPKTKSLEELFYVISEYQEMYISSKDVTAMLKSILDKILDKQDPVWVKD